MIKVSLNGKWRASGGDFKDFEAVVPGCVHTDLLNNSLIDDPYYRDNEEKYMWIGETDWTYVRRFEVDENLLEQKYIKLLCHGLDTFAHIKINDKVVCSTDNMFRTWEIDIKDYLNIGHNTIQITFESTYPYMKRRTQERYLNITGTTPNNIYRVEGSNYVRKMQCNYGWDWGPMCVTCGIWKDIEILGYGCAKIDDVNIVQNHHDDKVSLDVECNLDDYEGEKLLGEITLYFDDELIEQADFVIEKTKTIQTIEVNNPKLWWPNNLGEQNLYSLDLALKDKDGQTIDKVAKKIGLRTLRLDRHPDEWGESFQFVINGVPFFAKGANWIPIDTFVTRGTKEFYRQILIDAKEANMNFIRVWGGGIYEQDLFYELCDELGICVWQDFMFACAAYPAFDEKFVESFKNEAIDNIKRLRHHTCIALWCGNNELEHMKNMVSDEANRVGAMSWDEYKLIFEETIPSLLDEYAPYHDYWVSSSHTPGENRADPNDPTRGDAHLWAVWHGKQPFEWYRTCLHRFNSEFGFQSFPEVKVVNEYTLPEDRNITSYVMEKHQRSGIGNAAIIEYMLSWFKLPNRFDMLLWASQILQGVAIKYAVEHWRRLMPRGMGTLYWQLNDCWPVASWSSIDYQGNLKALHYMAKRFYSPILISGVESKDNNTVEIHLTNDYLEPKEGTIAWKLVGLDGEIIVESTFSATIGANSSELVKTLDISEYLNHKYNHRNVLLFFSFLLKGREVSRNTVYFSRPKHMKLKRPMFKKDYKKLGENEFKVTISADKPCLWVWADMDSCKAKYSDRFFDLNGFESKEISIITEKKMSLYKFRKSLKVLSLVDTFDLKDKDYEKRARAKKELDLYFY